MPDSVRVLIADDNDSFRDALSTHLSAAGYAVDEVPTADEAVARVNAAQGGYDFVLMDQFFPSGMDGIEATRAISSKYGREKARVILLTLYGDGNSSREALDAGAYRYIFRPCPEDRIVEVMQAARDIAELEGALTDKSSPLLRLIDSAGIGISIIDQSYRLLYMNRHQRGISRKDCRIGGICWIEYNRDFRATEPCSWCPTKVALGGRVATTSTISPLENELRHFRVTACPIRGREDRVIGVIEFVRDVTDEYLADKMALEARETQDRLKATLARVCALGYARARLYEMSEDRAFLSGRVEHGGGAGANIDRVSVPVREDPYSQNTLAADEPTVYRKGQYGTTKYDTILGRDGLEEWIEAPMRAGDRVVGTILVDNKPTRLRRPGSESEPPEPIVLRSQDIIQLAASAANEIAREREERRIREESRRLRELRQLSARVDTRTDPDVDLDDVVHTCSKLIGAQAVHIRVPDSGGLRLAAGFGPYSRVAAPIISYTDNESGSARVWLSGRRIIEVDASQDSNLRAAFESTKDPMVRAALQSIRSFASFPIIYEGKNLGVLNLQSDAPAFFGDSVCEAVEDFVSVIGPILHIENLVAELKAAQSRLRMAARMAAHRLNNPNSAIRMRIDEWRLRRRDSALTEEFTENTIDVIGKDTARIADIVSDLRRFLRSARAHIPAEPFDINALVRERLETLTGTESGIRVERDFDSNLPQCRLDRNLLADILDELIYNAKRALGGKGVLRVLTASASPEEAARELVPGGQYIRIVVSDSGAGVPLDKKEWIFEPFNSLLADGTGLGLAFVHDAVHVLGGRISEEGTPGTGPGCGACFVILLPVEAKEVNEDDTTSAGRR
jgi:signal transduction histidine kinase/CheY-like chemotaxis protein